MFERPKGGERALLVHMDISGAVNREDLDEFHDLVVSAGVEPVGVITSARHVASARYFVGTGKLEEIKLRVAEDKADIVLFNHVLTPSQERNLERFLECRVLDRTGLILDIFAQRARSHEGKLQVELAQLKHLSTRLVRGWTHLERQKGGIGLRGPGETQLETDRRLIAGRIKMLGKRLEKVRSQREQGRRARLRAEVPTVALVGYTNAGKSTLFNALVAEEVVYAADQLFATLDPTLRRIEIEDNQPIILADTVGFIRHLPHDLVQAFRSTLQETQEADLLLHVIDAAHEHRDDTIKQVNVVLKEIGAAEVPQIEVYNKIDLMGLEPRIDRDDEGRIMRVWVSAKQGLGMDFLRQAISEATRTSICNLSLRLPPSAGRLRALLYRVGQVRNEVQTEMGEWDIQVSMDRVEYDRLLSHEPDLRRLVKDQTVA